MNILENVFGVLNGVGGVKIRISVEKIFRTIKYLQHAEHAFVCIFCVFSIIFVSDFLFIRFCWCI